MGEMLRLYKNWLEVPKAIIIIILLLLLLIKKSLKLSLYLTSRYHFHSNSHGK